MENKIRDMGERKAGEVSQLRHIGGWLSEDSRQRVDTEKKTAQGRKTKTTGYSKRRYGTIRAEVPRAA